MKTNRQLSDEEQSEARRCYRSRRITRDEVESLERKCRAMDMLLGFIIGLTVGTCLGLALR